MKKCNILLILLVLPFLANGFNGKAKVGGLWYNIVTKAEKAEVTKPDVGAYSGAIRIPSTIVYEGVTCNVTAIGDGAFAWGAITSIDIPNSVTKIGPVAFRFCEEIKSINVPNSVTDIESMAFGSCVDLTNVKLSDNIKKIPYGLFEGCYQLKSIVIPAGVTKIDTRSFYGCKALTSITFNNALDSICDSAFQECDLKSISIPNSVSLIDFNAFKECKSLTTVIIGNGVKKINSWAFANCGDLKDFYFNGDVLPCADENVFRGSDVEYATLHVAESLIDVCKNTEPWKEFGNIVVNSNAITTTSSANSQYTKEEAINIDKGTIYQQADDVVYSSSDVQQLPEFTGGEEAMNKWIVEHIQYPESAINERVQGKVIIEFVVSKTGSIENPKVIRGLYPDLEKEALRLVKEMPKWNAGKLNGEPVSVRHQIPFNFKLPK